MALETGRDERTGLVLAGGYSTRFGERDKGLADLAGTPMIRRVVDRIDPVVGTVVVNCREEQVSPIRTTLAGGPNVSFAVDPVPDRGPMAGILTGLCAAATEYTFVVACDMPFVDPDLVAFLFDRAAGHDAAVPRVDDGWLQTTQAVYRTAPMARACERAIERGNRRIDDPLCDLDYVVVGESAIREHAALETFENVNTPEEFERAADRLEREG
ncbi:molybdenum cofactor guanylyltransferase [Halopiger djelfimassiliensis]|uniref:molybdenum cofactor guanylyltransferase n=1 Tax=Halopiger djelfimassiliensis TaxID=1293047 RepID=UPI000677F350|nr:molybdenum cofactor guanylyltransferase [Halopiger djelfimassiliensis]